MCVRVGQASGAFSTPDGIKPANHMSAIENSRNIKHSSAYLSVLRNARIYLPSRPLDMKKGRAAIDIDTRYTAETTRSAHDNAEVLVSKLKWPFLRRLLDLNKTVRDPEQRERY